MIDFFKESEKLLYEVTTMKAAIQNMQERHAALAKIASERPKAAPGKKSKGEFSDAERLWLEYRNTDLQIKHTKIIVGQIEQAMQQLENEERVILQLWYIDRIPKEKILDKMHYESVTSLYNIKNRAVRRFTMLYYGV